MEMRWGSYGNWEGGLRGRSGGCDFVRLGRRSSLISTEMKKRNGQHTNRNKTKMREGRDQNRANNKKVSSIEGFWPLRLCKCTILRIERR